MQKELVVWAELVNIDFKAVEDEFVALELKPRSTDDYVHGKSGYKYTLLGEVELRVREYLRGDGPYLLTAIVEGQTAFDSPDAEHCAKLALYADVSPLFSSEEGIALLEPTSDPSLYYMGRVNENFQGNEGYHSTWLPYRDGSFYNGSDGWISIAEVRQRSSSVIEEYTRSQDEEWQSCVYWKYFDKGSDPWAYRGLLRPYQSYRDHEIIFNGEHVPVPAGTMVWKYQDPSELHMRLEGKDAHLFEVAYHSEYELTFNEWQGVSGGNGFRLAIWYKGPLGQDHQWRGTTSGNFITAAEDLAEGVYQFDLYFEYVDSVDCGQRTREPSKFTVIVDKDKRTVPPAPTNVQVTQDQEGWTISWDPVHGADSFLVRVYRLYGDEERIDSWLGTQTEDSQHHIRLSDIRGCREIYIEISPHGDGMTYLRDFGESSEPIQLRAMPCPP